MTEKKELIQQLKENPDTYKQYRLEYMKSLFDLKKFQFLFLKNNQSRTWTEDYMKKLLSKRNDLLFDLSEIYHASLSAIYNDEFFKSNIKFAITDTKLKKELEWPEMVTVLDVMEADAYEPLNTAENYSDSNTAYVIFTSGSTGEPKGVEIAHFAAVNTIETINKQYRVSADDKIIAVSSYDFDLSVYDIFGILSAGGTLILIKDSNSRDAEVWLDIVERHSVTLWNSVPTLLNMLLIVAEGKGKEIPSLRLAMLSGDWIGMDIPERLNHVAKNSHLLSMGGATEASIWSNYFDVELPVPEEWSSIPYGKPLKNQYYRVVDSKERDCPTWVPGELWIGGTGVAKGYIGDSEITDKSFVNWNENRWYKTGDLGRYWADGNIEFLGRKDFQVKIRGHRIELGEIEAAMNKYPGVKKSVAAAIGDVQGNKYLAGYIIPENGHPESLFDVNKVSDTDLMDKWDRLWADLKEGVAEVTEENNVQEYMTLANCLDEVSREYMYSLMRTLGIWVEPGTKYKLSALLMSAGIDLSYQELIQQWVNELVKIGRILAEEDYFVNCSSPKEMDRAAFVEKYPGWEHEIDDALKYLEQFKKYCHAIMTGNMDTPELLAKDDYISPDVYMATLPGAIECKRTIKNILSLQKKEGTAGRTVRIMELGARNLELTSELLDCMDGMEYEYVCTDASSYYLNHAKEKFKNNSRVHYENLDINSAPNTQGLAMHYFDVVLAVSTLHRCRDIKASLKYAGEYLRAGGLLILLETTENTILQHVSTGILEKGFSTVTDERKGTGKPLLTKAQWSDAVLKSGFAKVNTVPNDQLDLPIYNQGVIVALAQPETYAFTDSKLNEIRAELAHKQYQADCWPLFDLYLTDTIDKSILHFSIDMLLSDFISMKTILNDLDAFYYEDGKNLKPLQVSFRDVLVYQKEHENDEEVRTKKDRDCEYWKKRLQNFPDAPELPILPESKCEKVTFTQYRHFITPENWSKLCEKARMQRLTPSGVVLSAYAEIIGRWSKRKDFCIDITILNRPSIHSQINEIVGDFTEVDILEISPEYPSDFVERTRKIQNQLWEDLSHSAFTGIDVLREINRQSEKKAIIPVVYTSTVGAADSEEQENWEFMRNSRITYKISQTPQVWIDCQVSEDNGGVLINWDVRDGVFPEGFVNDAFEAFSLLIERLCTNLKVWEQVHPVELPLKTGKVRKSVNKTEKDLPDKMLHEGFYNCLQNCPDEIALIAAEGTFSYKELGSYVAGIQNELCKSGFRKGDFVAISADKGMWQIAAVLAVLFSGGVYLPFDVSQPIARQNKILEKSGTKYLITNKKYQSLEWKEHIVVLAAEDINRTEQALTIVEIPLENPAYIIHTSGTTGDPKGVVISHKAAVNTIEDINSRFDINSADRMFGLANLAFDLSVYDIFGAFNAGAALVLPDPEKQKDPYYWVETIKKNEITVWNSVPAQMQMLVSVLESRGVSGDFPLKVVLLSGDWIPVTLPDQIHTSCKKAKVVSLGGATEAAIWSIYHEIEEVPDGAVSIPYGKPLANQKFYVLNEKMEQCPDWVPGDLYIGGKGLALEYLNKPDETNAHFMYDEQLQERIYKTGDIGRYWPDGTIEFMGREDTQVKIHGHRIELSEIESALLSNTLVKTAVAVIVGKRPQDYKIVAFVEGNIEVPELTEYIKTQVPEYMVPSRFEVNEKIPLSANGKVERKALKKLAETYFQNTGKCEMPPHEGLEKEIAELWKTLLKIDRVNRTDNFYDIGGDSLLVAQAVSKTKEGMEIADNRFSK